MSVFDLNGHIYENVLYWFEWSSFQWVRSVWTFRYQCRSGLRHFGPSTEVYGDTLALMWIGQVTSNPKCWYRNGLIPKCLDTEVSGNHLLSPPHYSTFRTTGIASGPTGVHLNTTSDCNPTGGHTMFRWSPVGSGCPAWYFVVPGPPIGVNVTIWGEGDKTAN